MKKLLPLLIVLLLLSAQLPQDQTAYYANLNTGGPVLTYATLTPLEARFFSTIQNGVVSLDGYDFNPTPGYAGLIQISGTCSLKRDPGYFSIILQVNQQYGLFLWQGFSTTGNFNITVPSASYRILLYQMDPYAANPAQCVVAFEGV